MPMAGLWAVACNAPRPAQANPSQPMPTKGHRRPPKTTHGHPRPPQPNSGPAQAGPGQLKPSWVVMMYPSLGWARWVPVRRAHLLALPMQLAWAETVPSTAGELGAVDGQATDAVLGRREGVPRRPFLLRGATSHTPRWVRAATGVCWAVHVGEAVYSAPSSGVAGFGGVCGLEAPHAPGFP